MPEPVRDHEADPMRFANLARQYINRTSVAGFPTVQWWNGQFWVWRRNVPRYIPFSPEQMTTWIQRWLQKHNVSSRNKTAEEVMHSLKATQMLVGVDEMPVMLSSDPMVPPERKLLLPFTNGLLDPVEASKVSRKRRTELLQPATPRYFSSTLMPYPFDAGGTASLLIKRLTAMLDGDKQRIDLLQEMAGYIVSLDNREQVALVLCGPEGTGKSTFGNILRVMMGDANCGSLKPNAFRDKYAPQQLQGKILNISDESGSLGQEAESNIKWYISGAPMLFERKYCDPYTQRPTARLVLCINNWPKIHDNTGSIYRRLKVVPFENAIPWDKQDAKVAEALMNPELACRHLHWALDGLARLRSKGFTKSNVSEERLSAVRASQRSHKEFVDDNIEAAKGGFIKTMDLEQRYRSWCRSNRMQTKGEFAVQDEIVRRFPGTKRERKRLPDGNRARGITGVKFK